MPTDYPGPLPATVFVLDGDPQPACYIDGPQWTQDEAIAYESARECIVHMMAIYTDALHHANPAPEDCAAWRAERARLAGELRELRLTDHAAVARVQDEYGARIKRGWQPITQVERRRREAAVNFARANVGLEGFKTTPEEEARCRRFIAGDIDLAAFIAGRPE